MTMGVGRVARVACLALCHGDCCWARRVGAAVPCGLLLGVSRGRLCAMGIAGGRVAWVALCDGDWWAARPLGGAVSWRLLSRTWSGWRRVIRIGEQGVVWVAPCLRDC